MKKIIAAGLVITTLTMGGIITSPQPSDAATTSQAQVSSKRNAIIQKGMRYIGTPYEFGSSRSNTRTFDCSEGVSLPVIKE
ncbi:hypothetical protein PAAL109150_24825 [Paenibacillus alkaliterrae]|uniref:hypothetical protein n=1 Tax=Paenibacillus alkaliterrae TaxID=320909 RepID=UPI002E1C45E2